MGTATRLTSTGTLYINGHLDEVTGMTVGTNLLLNLDASKVTDIANNTSVWTDVGPNQYNFSFSNSISYSTTNGGYYTFNGTNQTAVAGSNFADGLPQMTIAAWIRLPQISPTGTYPAIATKIYNLALNNAGWVFWFFWDGSRNRLSFYTQDNTGSSNGVRTSTTITDDGNWHYVAATFVTDPVNGGGNGTVLLYQDGALITNATTSGIVTGNPILNNSYSTSTVMRLGSDVPQAYGVYKGDIADVQVYNRALSAAEILNNYNANAALFGLTPTQPAPIMRTSTNTLYVNILDEASLNVGSMFVTQGGLGRYGYIYTSSATLPWTALSGTFTVEFWINWTTLSNVVTNYIGVPAQTNGFTITFDGTSIAPRLGGGAIGNAGTLINSYNPAFIPNTGQWYHIAVVRNSSNLIIMYVNGVAQGTGTTYSNNFTIGQWVVGNSVPAFSGAAGTYYMSGIRVSSSAVYTGAFSPPSSAPGLIPSTVFLMLTANSTSFLFDSKTGIKMTTLGALVGSTPTFNSSSPFNSNNSNLTQRLLSNGTLQVKGLVQTSL